MRMWMVNPVFMCDKHLRGEHVELHMLVGSINKRKSLKGFLDQSIIEPKSITERHYEISKEMKIRGMTHISPLPDYDLTYLGNYINTTVDISSSLLELKNRCDKCKDRINIFNNHYYPF